MRLSFHLFQVRVLLSCHLEACLVPKSPSNTGRSKTFFMVTLLQLLVLHMVAEAPLQNHTVEATQAYLRNSPRICLIGNNTFQLAYHLQNSSLLLYDFNPPQTILVDAYVVHLPVKEIPSQNCSSTKLVIISENPSNYSTADFCQFLLLFPNSSRFFDQSEKFPKSVNVSYLSLSPHNFDNGGRLDGFEGRQVQTVADHFGIQIKLIDRGESGWLTLEKDIQSGLSFLAFGALYPFTDRNNFSDLVDECVLVKLAWVAPLGAGKSSYAKWQIILISELSTTVWILTAAAYVLLVLLTEFFDRPSSDVFYRPFHVMGLILGSSQTRKMHRGFTASVVVFGFLMSAFYLAIMNMKLLIPPEPNEISSLRDVDESGISLSGAITAADIIGGRASLNPEERDTVGSVLKKFRGGPMTLKEALDGIVRERNLIFARHDTNVIYTAEKEKNFAGQYHIVEDSIAEYLSYIMLPKNSCFTRKFKKILRLLCASGLTSKWYRDYTTIRREVHRESVVSLGLAHVSGFFYLYLAGQCCATFAFAIEAMLGCWKICNKKTTK